MLTENLFRLEYKYGKLMKKVIIVFSLGLLLISIPLISSFNIVPYKNSSKEISKRTIFSPSVKFFKPESFTLHSPIEILSDQDFITYSFSGDGTSENPYVIQNLNITTLADYGIFITNTTKCFIIHNCFIDANYGGIFIANIAPNTAIIENNIFTNNVYFGLLLNNTSDAVISNNECFNNNIGLAFQFTNNLIIKENYCYQNSSHGISVLFSYNIAIHSNFISQGYYGISFSHVDHSSIENNTIRDNLFSGISIDTCNSIIVRFNNCSTSVFGIECLHSQYLTISNNTCDNNYDGGIFLSDTDSTNITSNFSFKNKHSGIRISICNMILIEANLCRQNSHSGIYIFQGDFYIANPPITQNNLCEENTYGISIYSSDYTDISYNIILKNYKYGVFLDEDSNRNKVHHNDFIDNNINGTKFGSSQGYDDGFGNLWYDASSSEGNYWSDHKGTDGYLIDGLAGSYDNFPFKNPVTYNPTSKANFLFTFLPLTFLLLTSTFYRNRFRKRLV